MKSLKRAFFTGTAWSLFLIAAALAASDVARGDWTTVGGNASHTGYVPVTVDASQIHLAWQKSMPGAIQSVAVAGGKVYASKAEGSRDAPQYLTALDANSGATIWSVNPDNWNSRWAPPVYADGRVFVQAASNYTLDLNSGMLFGVDASNGAVLTRTSFNDMSGTPYEAPTPFQGNVYFAVEPYTGIASVNTATGATNWTQLAYPNYTRATSAVDSQFVYSYLEDTTHPRGLYVLNAATGSPAYTILEPPSSTTGVFGATPILGSQHDAFVISNGLTKLNLQTHSIDWRINRTALSQASFAKGVVYAADSPNSSFSPRQLEAFDETTGQSLWTWSVGSEMIYSNLVVTDNELFLATGSSIFAINLQTHLTDWTIPYQVTNSPRANRVHLSFSEGHLYYELQDSSLSSTLFAYAVPSVPEPSSLILGGIGLAFFAMILKRRKASR